MAHPYADLRQSKVEKSRVNKLTHGYASGGAVSSAASSGASAKSSGVARKNGGAIQGRKSGGRLDRYARGGKVKGNTNVTVVVAPQGGGDKPPMPIPAMAPPMAPPKPPMPPMAGPPMPGGPPGMPPGGMPPPGIRRSGGRAYASGGAVSTPAWKEGLRNGTQVSHTDGKNDTKDIVRPRQVTYKKGGRVGGVKNAAGGGLGRLEKIALQKRSKR